MARATAPNTLETQQGRGGLLIPSVELTPDYGPKEFMQFFHGIWQANTAIRFPRDYLAYYDRKVEPQQLVIPANATKPLVLLDYSSEPRRHQYDSSTERMRVLTPPARVGDFQLHTEIAYSPRAEGFVTNRDSFQVTRGDSPDDVNGFRINFPEDKPYTPDEVARWEILRAVTSDFIELVSD
jgi:hypothetical protein